VSKARLRSRIGRLSGADMQKVEQAVKVQLSLSDVVETPASDQDRAPKPENGREQPPRPQGRRRT
jgi:hypothetical protein